MPHTNQLTEQIRIDIGKMLLAHEMIKLFPELFDYGELKTQINDQWSNLDDEVAVRDFWNLIDSIMMGYGLPDDSLHAPNEKLSLSMFEKGIKTNIEFLKSLG